MAFTQEAINEYFNRYKEVNYINDKNFTAHDNYKIVVDYLTGKVSSLQGIQTDYINSVFRQLPELITDIDPLSGNDQLLLDVIFQPDIFSYAQYFFFKRLILYATEKNNPAALQAALALFYKVSLTDSHIFRMILYLFPNESCNNGKILAEDSEVKKFLLTNMPGQVLKVIQPGVHWGTPWNFSYFHLIEETQPHNLEEYIVYGITETTNDVTAYLIKYKNGKYIDVITEMITQQHRCMSVESKFFIAAILYTENRVKYSPLVLNKAKEYLNYFQKDRPKEKWESHLRAPLLKDRNLTYSAAAFHLLFLDDVAHAKQLLAERFNQKVIVGFDLIEVIYYHLQREALPYLRMALQSDTFGGDIGYYKNIISLLRKEFQPEQYTDVLWEKTGSKSKPVREYLASLLYETDAEAEQKAIALLHNKNADKRQTASLMLSFFNTASAREAVKQVLNKEINDNTRDILLIALSSSLPEKADKNFISELVQSAALRKKLNDPVESWLIESDMPPLFYTTGEQFTNDELRFLFYRMTRAKGMRSDIEAKFLLELADRERSAPFGLHLLKLFKQNDGKPEYKYLMTLAALLGDDEIVDKLRTLINGWIDVYRTKMAEYGIGALALQGSNKALRLVELYSRKYKNKVASVGTAALNALSDAAEELKISTYELSDRIVPDFGFEELFKNFEIDGEPYRAFIDGNFKIVILNDDNKKLKALPSNAGADLKEEFKLIAKEIREVVKSQSLRLEYYLIIQRRWTMQEWRKTYLSNPVMFIYATKLLWGRYDNKGILLSCFTCLEDTTLIDLDENEIEIADDDMIGIVHPLQLDAALLQQWKKKFYQLSIDAIFTQLERPIANLAEINKDKKILTDFESKETENGFIKSALEKLGWRKGATGDGGYIDHFKFPNTTDNTEAILEVEGVYEGGYGTDMQPVLGRLYFINKSRERSKWFNSPKDDKDERLISLCDVDGIFYSEVVASVSSIKQKAVNAVG